uniref:Uncharacterized protein n=1 Tax=Anopheles atroparvus TaxID=41427 RepID=A0A182JJW7_ANOAO
MIISDSGWVLIKNSTGLQIYRMEGNDLNLRHYSSDGRYRAMYGWNDRDALFLMGHIYDEGGAIGVLSRNKRGAIRFEQMMKPIVLKGDSSPLWQLTNGPNVPESWKLKSTWLGLAIVEAGNRQQSAIVERSSSAITVYKLDENYQLHTLAHVSGVPFAGADKEHILFGNVFEPINPMRGSLDFAIPLLQVGRLFNIPTSKFITYQETDVDSSMGRGWSLQVDCVFIDRRGSIFEQDHRYYLVKDGSTSLLTANLHNDSSDKQPIASFTLEGSNQTTITFDHTLNQWLIVNDNGENFTYDSYTQSVLLEYTNLAEVVRLRRISQQNRTVLQFSYDGPSDLDTYTFNPPEQDGNTFVFGYRMENGKFKLKVIEHRGKISHEIEKIKEQIEEDIRNEPNAPEEEKERYRRESLEKINNELEDLYRNITAQIPFAIDPSKLGVIISDAHIITASHKMRFDGVQWSKECIPQEELTMDKISINLGSKYRLVKTHRNGTFDLVGPNQSMELNTETRDANNLYIRYPGFFAVQTNGSSVQLFDFERGQLYSLPADEKLEASSNQLAVISTQTDGKSLLIRSMKSFGVTLQNVIWRHDLIDSRQRRLTKYYQFDPHTAKPHESGFLLGDVKIIPVSTKGPYGWYKEHYNFVNHTLSTKTVYNSRGEFVKEIANSSIESELNEPLNRDGVLTARDGKTIVADFRPYRISEQVVSYYGFEQYEQNRIGSDREWTWKNGQVLQENGNHFLRLGRSSAVSGTFHPKNPSGTLVVSCWLRSTPSMVPPAGDMAIFCTSNRYSVWIDGHLRLENQATEGRLDQYAISSTHGQIWDAIVLYDTNVKVIYLTDFGMPKQIVELQNPNVVALQEIIYDELNRPAIKTKWTQVNATNSSELFAYRSNFVTNEAHIWKRPIMEGLVSELNADCAGYPYSRTVYLDAPDEEKVIQSVPGKNFAIDGAFAKHFNASTTIDFLENLFPTSAGFRYEYERYPDQSIYVKVHDDRKRKVAEYVRVRHGDHHLTTFQYDRNDRLILQLPPAYHEAAESFSRTTPFFEDHFSADLLDLQRAWGTWYEYDQTSGMITLKRTPDTGDTRYMYTPEGLLRFVTQPGTRNVMYFSYSSMGKLSQKGMIDLDPSELQKYLPNDSELPPSSNFVVFHHADNEVAPQHRYRVENIQKVTNDRVLSELLFFDHAKQLISSVLYSNANYTLPIGYKYCKNQIHEIKYPIKVGGKNFRLRYEYDHRGKVISMANAATNEKIVVMENNGMGLPKYMIVQPDSPYAFRRTFEYNQPGYLTTIKDPYLTESIDYIGKGYGGRPIGDGTVQTTRFNATWHGNSNAQFLKIKPSQFGGRRAKVCYDALKSSGHLDADGRPAKSMYPLLALELPIVCRLGSFGYHVAAVLNGAGFPQLYGHKYDYGSHRQLIRAKYFQNAAEGMYEPLVKDSFAKINGVNATTSAKIWTILHEAGYIHSDCSAIGQADCQGLPGKSIFHPTIAKHPNAVTLSSLMARVISHHKDLSKSSFDELCAGWYRGDLPNVILEACSSMWTTLINEQFIGPDSNFSLQALDPELRELLSPYTPHLPAIIGTLFNQLATALGYSSGDVQSYEIDANGNHRHFYTGFRRYRLEYAKNSNKIAAVHRINFTSTDGLEETRFSMHHNEDGSVTRAMHKGIQCITYDPLYNRATEIVLTDGRRLKFDYNVRGQRLYKHVYDRAGKLMRKKYYVRDVQGKPLIEYEAVYQGHNAAGDNAQPQEVVLATVFLYADDRLVGFIRNDQFYSVTLDHEGSVRLVVKNGEIVAAYDYLPYGELLRKYGEDLNGQLDYRFTGKEWDEETGLYDFHARLYDPELGRFYQMDPKEQYASPYLYAGNSPVSLIDPDGQFAFLIVAALAIGGAYLGASAANNSWNPTKWNPKKALIGGLVGALIGGLAPAGIAGGFTFLSGYIGATAAIGVMTATSVGFAYLSMASANGSWEPSKWDWSSPGTWNALFTGSLTGATVYSAIGGVQKAFLTYTGLSRSAFVIVATGTTGGFLLYSGSKVNDGNLLFWQWDWSKPGTVWGAIEGASFGLTISPKLNLATQQVAGRLQNFKEIGKALKAGNIKAVSGLLKEEAKAWQQIIKDIIAGEHVKDGLEAGKAAGAKSATSLLPKIPDDAMKAEGAIWASISHPSTKSNTLDDSFAVYSSEDHSPSQDTDGCPAQAKGTLKIRSKVFDITPAEDEWGVSQSAVTTDSLPSEMASDRIRKRKSRATFGGLGSIIFGVAGDNGFTMKSENCSVVKSILITPSTALNSGIGLSNICETRSEQTTE